MKCTVLLLSLLLSFPTLANAGKLRMMLPRKSDEWQSRVAAEHRKEVRRALTKNRTQFEACGNYLPSAETKGELVLNLLLADKTADLISISPARSDERLRKCFANALDKLKFPVEGKTMIQVPFKIRR